MPFGEFPEIRRRNFTRPPGKELGEITWGGEGKTWKAIGRTVCHAQVDQQDLPLRNVGHVWSDVTVRRKAQRQRPWKKMPSVFQLSSAKKTTRASSAVVYYSQ